MNDTRAALRDRLTELGETEVDAPSRAFTAGLERQLLGSAGVTGATLLALPARPRTTFTVLSATAAAVAAAVLVGALLGVFGRGGGTPGLSLAAAVDTTVVLPGGQTVPGRSGLVLPNGAVVWTGPNGRAAAGAVELGPGLRAVVNQGRLELLPAVASSVPGSPVVTPAPGASGSGGSVSPTVTAPHVSPTLPVTLPAPSVPAPPPTSAPKGLPVPTLPTLPPIPNLLGLP